MSVPYTVSEPYDYNGISAVDINDGTTIWIQLAEIASELSNIYNMEVREDDVWLLGYPKSGNTWASEMLWTIHNGTKEAIKTNHIDRICWPEMRAYNRVGIKNFPEDKRKHVEVRDYFQRTVERSSPRIIRSHLPLSLLPPNLLDTAKVIYICRNLKDCAVSFFKMLDSTPIHAVDNAEEYLKEFMLDRGTSHPACEQIRESWEKRHHSNMYFLFYEDMIKDLPTELRKVAAFLGKSLTDEEVARYTEHLSVENMRKNKNLSMDVEFKRIGTMVESSEFVRKGVVGDWKNYFTPERTRKWDKWTSEKFAGTDFKFKE